MYRVKGFSPTGGLKKPWGHWDYREVRGAPPLGVCSPT